MRRFPGWVVACAVVSAACVAFGQSDSANPFALASPTPIPSTETATLIAKTYGLDQPTLATDEPILADDSVDNSADDAAKEKQEQNNVYAPTPPPKEDEGINNGGAHLDLDFIYVNRYVYRGVDHDANTRGNTLNLLLNGRLSFDFGSFPHPFIGVFTDVVDSDPVSNFQEFRPTVGATWNLRPFLLEGGATNYIYPQREQFDTQEVYFQTTIDDSLLFHTADPILSPYVLSVYDYHLSQGWYIEGGIKHDFTWEDLGLTFTVQADLAYINAMKTQFIFVNHVQTTGLQHAEFGLTASYSLNQLLHMGLRFGEFDAKGYLFYDDKLLRDTTANYVLWGGAGIGFKY
jgi:hypothetical protein